MLGAGVGPMRPFGAGACYDAPLHGGRPPNTTNKADTLPRLLIQWSTPCGEF